MDVQDGFIVGIFDYCDRWCEQCGFTSNCRLFADKAELEATLNPTLKPIADAPPCPKDSSPQPAWIQELIDEMNNAVAEAIADGTIDEPRPPIAPEHGIIEERALAYAQRVHAWLTARDFLSVYEPPDPRAVIGWFQYSIPAKAHRALRGLAYADREQPDGPADHDGSAKVALLAIERSHAAWLNVVHTGLGTASEVEPFIADLIALSDELDRVFPNARTFVRPAFDEPDEVAKLYAAERTS
jgi:hypothetical protein